MAEMRFENARDPEQLRIMEELAKQGKCYFCLETFNELRPEKIIFGGPHWFVTENNFPNKGGVKQFLIVSKTHITKVTQLSHYAKLELFECIAWLERHLEVDGESIFVRSGNMDLTGATIDHLHFHFISGDKKSATTEKVKVTLGHKEPQ